MKFADFVSLSKNAAGNETSLFKFEKFDGMETLCDQHTEEQRQLPAKEYHIVKENKFIV